MELPNNSDRIKIIESQICGLNVPVDFMTCFSRETAGKTPGLIIKDVKQALLASDCHSVSTDGITESLSLLSISDKLKNLQSARNFTPIHGYDAELLKIERLLTWPYKHKDSYTRLGIGITSGILLYGPSGCGKTSIAHYMSVKTGLNLINVSTAQLCSKYLGQTEKNIRQLFSKAKSLKPSLLLLDDIDTIAEVRQEDEMMKQRVVTTLLNEMDGIEESKGIVVLACTNRPWKIDPAILRHGRLDSHIFIGLPSSKDRESILKNSDVKLDISADNLTEIIRLTEGYTPADLNALLREAGILCIKSRRSQISFSDIIGVLNGDGCFNPAVIRMDQYKSFGSKV